MRAHGFSKATRLLNEREFKAVFDENEYRVSKERFLVLAKSTGLHRARLGLVVSKKNVPGAVQRNRIKRLIRESFRQKQSTLEGLDIIVLTRKGVADLPNQSVYDLLTIIWEQLACQNRKNQSVG